MDEVSAAAVAEEFFDPSFIEELEGLARFGALETRVSPSEPDLEEELRAFLAPSPGDSGPLDEAAFVALPEPLFTARTNALLETFRRSPRREAGQSVESFAVFVQALVPTLSGEGAGQIKRAFFRLVPTLLHIAYHDFAPGDEERGQGRTALRSLETILLEIASIRLAPSESELVFRSIDQLASLIDAGQYELANELLSSRLLTLLRKNKLARALFRLMEAEVNVQCYLKEKLGYTTPQIRIPEDETALSDYGPIRVLREESGEGSTRTFLQFQLPDLPILRDVVLTLVREDGLIGYELRFDNLGSVELNLAPATYRIGLAYQPE
jgi:hypothetical protein